MAERITGIKIVDAKCLPIGLQLDSGISKGFVEIRSVRGSPLKTKIVAITGSPAANLRKQIEASGLVGTTFSD